MSASPRHTLIVRLGLAGCIVLLAVAAAWLAPTLAARILLTPRSPQHSEEPDEYVDLDKVIATSISRVGLTELVSREQVEGLAVETWRVPAARTVQDVAGALVADLKGSGIRDLHASPRDVIDFRVRVYGGRRVTRDIWLVPDLSHQTAPPKSPNRRERPLISLVISGVGDRSARALTRVDVPLTLAIYPRHPYTLAAARDAAFALHEVLVDLDDHEDQLNLTPADALAAQEAARAAVPFSTGFLLRSTAASSLAQLDRPGTIVDATEGAGAQDLHGSYGPDTLLVVPTWRRRHHGLQGTLQKLRFLAKTRGHTTLTVEATDPILAGILAWIGGPAADNYRVVLASEAGRPDDITGAPDAPQPDAPVATAGSR